LLVVVLEQWHALAERFSSHHEGMPIAALLDHA